jgi:hypothetical protein
VACCCGYTNEPSGSIKAGEFLDKVSDCQFLNEDFAPWSELNWPSLCSLICVFV